MTDCPYGADLHLHTIYSDGIYTPESLVRTAIQRRLRAVAVTDHDSVSGVARTCEAAVDTGLEVVPGIELAVPYGDTELHIVGLFLDIDRDSLRRSLVEIRARRRARIVESVRRLGRLGVHVNAENVFANAEPGLPGRVHLAHALVASGAVPSFQAAFQRYLGNGKQAYVERRWPSIEKAVEILHDAGGAAVFAHPLLTDRDRVIPKLVVAGLDAIEVTHPSHSADHRARYREICLKYDLLPCAGSDCHGTAPAGGLIGTARLPDEDFFALKRAAADSKAVVATVQENAG